MAASETYTISTLTSGTCLETRGDGLSTGKYDSSGKTKAQLWTIEQSEDGKSFAFRSVAAGQYLRAAGEGDNTKGQTGDKMWWTLESGDAPGSWWMKSNDFGNYLFVHEKKLTANTKVVMRSTQLSNQPMLLQWYVNSSNASSLFSPSRSTESASTGKESGELEAKEKSLKKREQKLEEDEKDAAERENAAVEREQAVAAREQKSEARVKAIGGIEASTKQRREEIEAKEKALKERLTKLEEREQAVADKENTADKSSGGSSQVADLQRQLSDAQRDLENAKAAQEKQADELKRIQPEAKNKDASSASTATNDETVKLEQRIKELEAQLASTTPSTPTKPKERVEQERQPLKPIIVQKSFGFLPRKDDSRPITPLSKNTPIKTLPSQAIPPNTQPPKTQPPKTEPPTTPPPSMPAQKIQLPNGQPQKINTPASLPPMNRLR